MSSTVCLNVPREIGQQVVNVTKKVVNEENISLGIRILNIIRHIGSTSKNLLKNDGKLHVVGALKLVNLGKVPLIIYGIGVSFFSAVKATLNEKIDVALDIIASLGSLLDIAATVAEGLAAVGAVALKVIKWATPVAIVAAAVEAVAIILTTKKIIETHRFSKIFNEAAALRKPVGEYTLEDFSKARRIIIEKHCAEKSFVAKHFRADSDKLLERLNEIELEAMGKIKFGDEKTVLEGKQQLQSSMQALSRRMVTNKLQGGLNILSGVIGIIGVGLLFCPFPPAGFILMAISGVLSIAGLFIDKGLNRKLEKQLGM